jgi:hypothetical protein
MKISRLFMATIVCLFAGIFITPALHAESLPNGYKAATIIPSSYWNFVKPFLGKTVIKDLTASYTYTPTGGKVTTALNVTVKKGVVSVNSTETHAYTKEATAESFVMDTRLNDRIAYTVVNPGGSTTSETLTLASNPVRYRAVVTEVTDKLLAAYYYGKNPDLKYVSDKLNNAAGRTAPSLADKSLSAAVSYTPVSSKATSTVNVKVENNTLTVQKDYYHHYLKQHATSDFSFDLSTGRITLYNYGYNGYSYEIMYRDQNPQRYDEIVGTVKDWLFAAKNYADATNRVGFQKTLNYLTRL